MMGSLSDPFGETYRFFTEREMANLNEVGSSSSSSAANSGGHLFKDEDIRDMSGLIKGEDFIEVTCGCTSRKYGDYVGKLRVFRTGDLEVKCECVSECQEGVLTPLEFEKHSGKEGQSRWTQSIWVMVRGRKVALASTVLLKYYNRERKASGSCRGRKGRPVHRDEFICCTKCNKMRRFRLRNKRECHIYHDALAKDDWKCSDFPLGKLSCDMEEERASRKALTGCPRTALCKGCTSCVCFGCEMCRYTDCSCQTCVDFVRNADI